MRRGSFAELPFTKTERRERQPAPVPDGPVTRVGGRAYLQETSRHNPDYSVTVEDRLVMDQRRLEAVEARQARATANLAAALSLGAALRGLADE
jgi:hypothetical protein